MKLSQMYRAALIATMMLILSSRPDMRGFAQANSPQGVKNIVLVHGAWADRSCWSRVIALLQAKGFVPANHLVMLSHPREVAELIEQAAAKAK
jgi:hypothetical protein